MRLFTVKFLAHTKSARGGSTIKERTRTIMARDADEAVARLQSQYSGAMRYRSWHALISVTQTTQPRTTP